jgi:hypothetical protein
MTRNDGPKRRWGHCPCCGATGVRVRAHVTIAGGWHVTYCAACERQVIRSTSPIAEGQVRHA